MTWQKRARFVLAILGIASAIGVYSAIGERQKPAPSAPPARLDPKALVESSGNILQEVRGTKLDYVIQAERVLTYEGGATKLMGVEVKVRERAGRDFVISGREAQAGENQKDLQLTGNVKLSASDGFVVMTDHATFNQEEGIVRAPDAVTFEKGHMSGSGTGMSYDKNIDLLTITDQSHVRVTGDNDKVTMEFFAGQSVLSRMEDYLTLERSVHVLRDQEIFDADKATARFTANEEHVTFIELRGNASATGGADLSSMKARDIDLDYTDDGTKLERVTLTGQATIAMKGDGENPGRVIRGETLNMALAPDGSVSQAIGHEKVELELPAAAGGPARVVKAATLASTGEPGKGLTAARFTTDVEYREQGSNSSVLRTARADALQLAMVNDAVSSAVFTGRARFEEQGLQARAAEARYDPVKGILQLTGTDAGGRPRVSDDRVAVDADAINLTLNGHQMVATGTVKTTMQATPTNARGPAPGAAAGRGNTATSKLPGLLKQEQAANVSASSMDYQGAAGSALYKGDATLWQGETAIRADAIVLDQGKGNLIATGAARSTIVLDDGTSTGRANEIRWDDATRQITYSSPLPPAKPAATGPAAAPAAGAAASPAGQPGVTTQATTPAKPPSTPQAAAGTQTAPDSTVLPSGPVPTEPHPPANPSQLSGPQGDLRAERIELVLGKTANALDRVEAYNSVSVKIDTRVATGARLTYFAQDGRYLLSGASAIPVKVIEECREITGKTLTFFKSADRIIVDGNEEIRTQTKRGATCTGAPAR